MSDISKLEAIEAARAEFNIKSPDAAFKIAKNKKSQAVNNVMNVVSFVDTATEARYTISINAGVTFDKDKGPDPESEIKLAKLQAAFTEFLSSIHDKL